MKNATTSMYVQALYMFIAGSGFLTIPNTILPLLGMSTVDDAWIRVIGLLVMILAYYYYTMTRLQVVSFFRASVWGRYAFSAGMVVFAATGISEMPVLLFAALDVLLATWTFTALRQVQE